jgi:hypothetical protein
LSLRYTQGLAGEPEVGNTTNQMWEQAPTFFPAGRS